jgi:hypothetical protein
MPFIESTSKFSSGLSLLYISLDKLLEFRIVLIKWLLYSAFVKDILDEENKFKTYDELKNQLNCKLNFLKYFSLISMIKSKNVTNITNAEYISHLINTILNSKSLSREISKISSNYVFTRFQNSFTTGQSQI